MIRAGAFLRVSLLGGGSATLRISEIAAIGPVETLAHSDDGISAQISPGRRVWLRQRCLFQVPVDEGNDIELEMLRKEPHDVSGPDGG